MKKKCQQCKQFKECGHGLGYCHLKTSKTITKGMA